MSLCSVPGCFNVHKARGYCTTHHRQLLDGVDPMRSATRTDGDGRVIGYRLPGDVGHADDVVPPAEVARRTEKERAEKKRRGEKPVAVQAADWARTTAREGRVRGKFWGKEE